MDPARDAKDETWFIAIGASGGEGLRDIRDLLARLEPGLPAVVMVVLHRPFDQPSRLCEVLRHTTRMPVTVADDGMKLERGHCYIGQPAQHLTLLANTFGGLVDDPERHYRNRTVDLLFGSVARFGRSRTVGIVMSGSLDDGSRGLEAIHAAGGITMVLVPTGMDCSGAERSRISFSGISSSGTNEVRADRSGMPRNAIAYGSRIDCIGPVEAIARALHRLMPAP